MIMCVLLWYPVSIHMSQLLSTGHPISSFELQQIVVIWSYIVITVIYIFGY